MGELLLELGALDSRALEEGLDDQAREGGRIGALLVRKGRITERELARALGAQLGLEVAEPPLVPAESDLDLVGTDLARRAGVVPIAGSERRIRLAMVDPLDFALLDDLSFRSGRRVEALVAAPSDVTEALDRAAGVEFDALVRGLPCELTEVREADARALEEAARSAPVVRLVDRILDLAVERRASDIHLEGGPDSVVVRLREDGILREAVALPGGVQAALVSRLKVMAGLDISVKRRPQDGGFMLARGSRELTVRMSTVPVGGGEKAVLRLLDPDTVPRGLDGLGLSAHDLDRIRRLTGARRGVVLVAGPTGSGKSSTLFGAISELDRARLNVLTLEDPVEYRADGVCQIQVDPRGGLGFPTALRAVLRQDPDVIMVGEIRDRETAEIAMAAAITGHLVLSTIHTPDAPTALDRLAQMGVPRYLIAGGVTGVIAQRLMRRLCEACGKHRHLDGPGAGGGGPRTAGCTRCREGYRGRTGVFEVMIMDDRLREAVIRDGTPTLLRRLAEEGGMTTMLEDARAKVAGGVTSADEADRVLRDDPGSASVCGGCGEPLPNEALGCPWCGIAHTRVCRCGRRLRTEWRYCPECLERVG